MKKRMLCMLMGLLLNAVLLPAQEIPGNMINAFKKGNAKELSVFLGEKVELVFSNSTKECDEQGAQQIMANFFSTNKVSDFVVNHSGQRNESGFIVGTLTTQAAEYRVNCYFKKTADQYIIYQIRIDKTNE